MPDKFILMADDNADLPYEFYEQNQIAVANMPYVIDHVTYRYPDKSAKEFYDVLRAGKMPSTVAANVEYFKEIMEPYLKGGHDILYPAFSSGLSSTCHNAQLAAEELMPQYPGRKIIVIDTLCASLGEGLLLYKVNQLKQKGASLEEAADWTVNNRLHVAHYVMADDLMHLHRGGRVSRTSAIAGSLLGIKPIIHVNDEGKLIPIDKIRGKKQALTNIVDKMEKAVGNTPNDFFTICHADCEEDAQFVAELASARFGIKDYLIHYIGPVIGSHTGIGTISLFLMADHR